VGEAVAAIVDLLDRVNASDRGIVFVFRDDILEWSADAVSALKSQQLIERAPPANHVVCPGCEEQCAMPVQRRRARNDRTSVFVVCDRREDINRVEIDQDRLEQWQSSVTAICNFVAAQLGLHPAVRRMDGAEMWQVGMAFGRKRSQMICIRGGETLSLVVGGNSMPLAGLFGFNEGCYCLDADKILHMVDASETGDPRYTPNRNKAEERKLRTAAMYQAWQKEYRRLMKKRPGMSDSWYSKEIAKSPAGHGRDSETIRKNMKR